MSMLYFMLCEKCKPPIPMLASSFANFMDEEDVDDVCNVSVSNMTHVPSNEPNFISYLRDKVPKLSDAKVCCSTS